jgi:hypothetical protein
MHRFAFTALRTIAFIPTFCAFASVTGCAELPEDETFEDEETAQAEDALETFASQFMLVAQHSGRCVVIEGASQGSGSMAEQWDCNGTDNGKFTLDSTGDGYYRIVAKHSGQCLDVSNGSTADGAPIAQWPCSNGDNQRFKPVPAGNGHYTLVAKHSGKCVDVSQVSTANGADIWQWNCYGGSNQLFKLAPVETRGNLLYGYWTSSGGQSVTSGQNRAITVDYSGPTRAVTFDLTSSIDTYLYLLDGNGNVLAQNDDFGGGASSRISYTLSTGTYKLVAATFGAGKTGEFAISSDLASLRYPQSLYVQPVTRFVWIYDDAGTEADNDVSIWRPDLAQNPGYYSLGDVAMPNHGGAPRTSFVVKGDGDLLAKPLDYNFVWDDKGSGGDHDGSFWEPVAPAGYTCLGHVAVNGYAKPSTELIRCIKSAYVIPANSAKIWDDAGSGADRDIGIWEATTQNYRGLPTSHFISRPSHSDNGGSGRYRALNKSATANEELRGGAVTGLVAAKFSPRIYMDTTEAYFPSSAAFFQANVHEDNGYLVTNQSLGCDNCTNPAFLDGQRPDQNRVPVYAEIVKHQNNGIDTTDVIYWMFYPYNNGKVVCVGAVTDWGCAGDPTRFGNHVGDWEHMTVRFIDGRPSQVFLAQHSHGDTFAYGQKHLDVAGFHANVYAAKGSHGLYADTGKHVYENLPNGDYLADYTSDGIAWDTWKTVVPFEWQSTGSYTGALSFLNITSRWGNRKSGCGFWEDLAGECILNDGPEAPMVKDFASPTFSGGLQ